MKKLYYLFMAALLATAVACNQGEPNQDRPLTGGHGAGVSEPGENVGEETGDPAGMGPSQDSTHITTDSAVDIGR